MIKSFCNSLPCTFWWHNGNQDDKCQFHGLHIHLIVVQKQSLEQAGKYRTMKRVLNTLNVQCKYQKVRNLDALIAHLQTPPRVLLGANNAELLFHLENPNQQRLTTMIDDHEVEEMFKVDIPDASEVKPDIIRKITEKLQWGGNQNTVKGKRKGS